MSKVCSWLATVSSIFCALALAITAGVLAGPGCQKQCTGTLDCVEGNYCSPSGQCVTDCTSDEDCLMPPECRDAPDNCAPRGLLCSSAGRCYGDPEAPDVGRQPIGDDLEGWEDAPGSGRAYIVNQFQIADADRGLDVDGECGSDSCIDNTLAPLGEIANDRIRQGLLSGESLLLFELVGLNDGPYRGDDESLTIKFYSAQDADEPSFPADNFKIPPGRTSCCEFNISSSSLTGPPRQAVSRIPARVEREHLRSLAPVPVLLNLTLGNESSSEIRLEQALLSGYLPRLLNGIEDGLLGGVVPAANLANIENTYCRMVAPRCPVVHGPTILDVVTHNFIAGSQTDVDLDGDGLECIKDTDSDGSVDLCCDREVQGCSALSACANVVPPLDSMQPYSCALDPAIADGYSIAFDFNAVPASIVSVGQ